MLCWALCSKSFEHWSNWSTLGFLGGVVLCWVLCSKSFEHWSNWMTLGFLGGFVLCWALCSKSFEHWSNWMTLGFLGGFVLCWVLCSRLYLLWKTSQLTKTELRLCTSNKYKWLITTTIIKWQSDYPLKLRYLDAFLELLTMKEFPIPFFFTGGMANLLCLLSSYEAETKEGRRLVILLRGSLTIDLNRSSVKFSWWALMDSSPANWRASE